MCVSLRISTYICMCAGEYVYTACVCVGKGVEDGLV